LAALRGIGDSYRDYHGELQPFDIETKAAILRAMGCPTDDPAALAGEVSRLTAAHSRNLLPPVAASRLKRIGFDLNVGEGDLSAQIAWVVRLEQGGRLVGTVTAQSCPEIWRGEVDGAWVSRRHFELPCELPAGYHELEAAMRDGACGRCLLIVSPGQCHEPAAISSGRRLWGVAVQLYTVRSRANWGIGDFGDLETLIRWLAARGAAFIGLNPLHALAPADPGRGSPYSASSRLFLNVLYIAVPKIPEFTECAAAVQRLGEAQFESALAALRASSLVDYAGVARAKFEMLELLYRDFRDRQLTKGGERAQSFKSFAAAGGEALTMHARFDAIDRHLTRTLGISSGWLGWPQEYRDIGGAAASRLAEERADDVQFFVYLQWLAHEQLGRAQALARELSMPVGLYGDYAVGANPGGSETWADRGSYCMGAEIGAPPDPLALLGQGWGIPPPDPIALEQQRFAGFVRLIRSNMRLYGAMRLDHVMGMYRLWWVPSGRPATMGAYVHYPLHELLTVLTLESARASCLVVGEDLGVVPDEMRVAMPLYGLYHYKVLLFEKQDGRFRRPAEFLAQALATVTTHDMPTLRGFWEGRDIDLRQRLNLYPSPEMHAQVLRERTADRGLLLAALAQQNLSPAQPAAADGPFTPELAQALHLYLARSNAVLAAVQIEDLLGMADPVNVPGTYLEYPNWQRKLTSDLEDIVARADLESLLDEINRARG
jgi:4-alpha-glucanotransferase